MARGGKRKGAGRPRGAINKLSAAVRAAAKKTGLLPHEALLAISQGRSKEVLGFDVSAELRIRCMEQAAPFYAPKLLAMAVKATTSDNPFEELLRLVDGQTRGLPSQNDRQGLPALILKSGVAPAKSVLDKNKAR